MSVCPICGDSVPDLDTHLTNAYNHSKKNPSCKGCGGPHPFDTSLPNDQWNAVIRYQKLPEYLCFTCIVKEFAKVGKDFTCTLWGDGFNGQIIDVYVDIENRE